MELAQFLRAAGYAKQVGEDLKQLFRRVALNAAVGNRDDHLRNDGFILADSGWRLAPAFDVNPNIDRADHVLNIDYSDNRPSLATVLSTAASYGLNPAEARTIVEDVAVAVDGWRTRAAKHGIARADIEISAAAFATHDDFRLSANGSR